MDGPDFISFGDVSHEASFDAKEEPRSISIGGERKSAKTKEERQEIGRAFRLAAKKEKKKIKSDAKKQRAQNAILHRRANKNSEKYVKNKERNRVRDIDAERHKIRLEAVRQAERLAEKHDPSGRSFNVSEVIMLADGKVRSKASYEAAEDARLAKERGEETAPLELPKLASIEGVNPERLGRVQGIPALDGKTKMSKTAQKKLLDHLPKSEPPRPIIPAGVKIPDGEENWLALWDINDDEVWKRISKAKSDKKNAAKRLRKLQQEQKKFNKALKAKKKSSMNQGVPFDRAKATKEVLAEQAAANKLAKAKFAVEEIDGGDWASDSGSDPDSESDSGSVSDSEGEEETNLLSGLDGTIGMDPEPEIKRSKTSKRAAEEVSEDEPAPKKTKKSKSVPKDETKPKKNEQLKVSSEDVELEEAKEKSEVEKVSVPEKKKKKSKSSSKSGKSEEESTTEKKKKDSRPDEPEHGEDGMKAKKKKKSKSVTTNTDDKDADSEPNPPEPLKKEKKRKEKASKVVDLDATSEGLNALTKVEEKRACKLKNAVDKKAEELLNQDEPSSKDKKRKRKHSTTEDTSNEKPEKIHKKDRKEGLVSAGQWNPEALNGDAERKNKFLRLLGGKKGGNEVKVKSTTTVGEIQHMTSELERQFEQGTMRKNDGGGKRMGLGA